MNPAALEFLCCPMDQGDLRLEEARREEQGRIVAGGLTCERCGAMYPIRDAIPRFVAAASGPTVQGAIAENFGQAWQLYAQARTARAQSASPYTEDQFLDWIHPLTPADFAGKTVLDLGSGLGGFAGFAAQYGAAQVIGLEISEAVDAALPLLLAHPNLTLIQADLLKPPIRPASIDLLYSIGVLHHLEAPEEGYRAAATLVRPGGQLFAWVYGRENNDLVVYLVDPLRRLLSRLPVVWVRRGVAFPMSLALYPLLHTLYHPLLDLKALPYYAYFQWLRRYGFAYVVGMVTDQLIPPRTHYLRREELLGWVERAGLALESLTPRNAMSWRLLARRTG